MSELKKISHKIIISIGSNIKPKENILLAIEKLRELYPDMKISKFYKSLPLNQEGKISNQTEFINCAMLIESNVGYEHLNLSILRKIETEMGRIRVENKYASRVIDLDILIYGTLIEKDNIGNLYFPDPDIFTYPHIYLPILDLEPEIIIPGSEKQLRSLINLNIEMFEIQEMNL